MMNNDAAIDVMKTEPYICHITIIEILSRLLWRSLLIPKYQIFLFLAVLIYIAVIIISNFIFQVEVTKSKMDSSLQYICGSVAAAITGAVATAAVYIATRPPPKIKRNFDLNAQSEELPVRTSFYLFECH